MQAQKKQMNKCLLAALSDKILLKNKKSHASIADSTKAIRRICVCK
jgi:hypothetical protein